jgi:hypothetical protein
MRAVRLLDRPIITPDLHPSIGRNIQGPSAIRAPDWISPRLGNYYLYFADHKGRYIRLAYADRLTGPWNVYPPGSLQLEKSCFLTEPPKATSEQLRFHEARFKAADIELSHDVLSEITTPHIASPDVQVDRSGRRIMMYYHGLDDVGTQVTRVAISRDGIDFEAQPEVLGRNYMRIFQHDGMIYALAMPGLFYRSKDGLHDFEPGPTLFNPNMRHSAVIKRNAELLVFWTQVGDTPERIMLSRIDLAGDWRGWHEGSAWRSSGRSAVGRAPTRRSSRRSAALPTVPSISCATPPSSRKTDGSIFFMPWPARAASRSPSWWMTRLPKVESLSHCRYRSPRVSGGSGAGSATLAMDARFRGHDDDSLSNRLKRGTSF